MEIYTTGFTKKSAEQFFSELKSAGIEQLIDVRINNTSQLAGFAKRDDFEYFLRELCGVSYVHEPLLAPTKELLKAYRDKEISWGEYEQSFLELIRERGVEDRFPSDLFQKRSVLLCSENKPDKCHRRLVVEYLANHWAGVSVIHL